MSGNGIGGPVRVAIVQTKPRKGRYSENLNDLRDAFALVMDDGAADVIVLPEAALTGYFLEGAVYDLALPVQHFADDLARMWREAGATRPVEIACGFFENDGGTYYNSAAYVRVESDRAQVLHLHRKLFLPTYGVFDEERFLSRGHRMGVFASSLGATAMLICEDIWHAIVPTIAALKGARVLLVPSAAPGRGIEGGDELESIVRWREILENIAAEHGVYVVYAGLTGFEGGKGMSGTSRIVDPRGNTVVAAPPDEACIVRAALDPREIDLARANLPLLGDLRAVLPDLLLDEELPLPRGRRDASDR